MMEKDVAVVVGVHGIGHHRTTVERVADGWRQALVRGMLAAGHGRAMSPPLSIAFYGHLFRRPSPYLGPDGPGDENAPMDNNEAAFVSDVLSDVLRDLPDDELARLDARAAHLGPPALWPPAVTRALAWVPQM